LFCLCHPHLFLITQTLITLDLKYNGIGEKGAQYLADALKNKTVNSFFCFCLSHLRLFLITQTLTTLNLTDNEIGDNGAQDLADGLKNNTVNIFFILFLSSASIPYHTGTDHTRPATQ
jgi:Ran GTPase-activating protein (RanGAP) involved in mRNA processing and transport